MTLESLLHRIKETSAVEVLNTIAGNHDEAVDFILTLGPHLLAPLLGEERRKVGIVRPGAGVPSPRPDWSRLDWKRWTDWMGRAEQGFRNGKHFGQRVLKAYGANKQLPYAQLRAKLDPEDAARLDKLCGKALAA